jgi:hypothetical protein
MSTYAIIRACRCLELREMAPFEDIAVESTSEKSKHEEKLSAYITILSWHQISTRPRYVPERGSC